MKLRRPDLLCGIRQAVEELDREGSFSKNKFCGVFNSCRNADQKLISEHSDVYFVCPSLLSKSLKYTREGASLLFSAGGATAQGLPGVLGKQGDDNVFCSLANFITHGMEKQVLPMFNMTRHLCIVQECFINRQRSGAYTNPHLHPDDFFGGVFYLDADADTRLCYNNNERGKNKQIWRLHAPGFTASLGPK